MTQAFIIEEREDGLSQAIDYVAETELTASNVFRCDHIGDAEFVLVLESVIAAAQRMDKYKKAMFRKKSRIEAGLPVMAFGGDDAIPSGYGQPLSIHQDHADLYHGVVGSITEVGELAEILYDHITKQKTPDIVNVREEIGDVLWYLARLVKYAATTFVAEMFRNIHKLRTRHGTQGFNKEADTNRNLEAEREVLEGREMSVEEAEMYCKDEEAHPEDYHR